MPPSVLSTLIATFHSVRAIKGPRVRLSANRERWGAPNQGIPSLARRRRALLPDPKDLPKESKAERRRDILERRTATHARPEGRLARPSSSSPYLQ